MSSALDRAVKHFKQAIQEAGSNKTSPFDTQAEVMRVEDGVAWVHMPGGVDETPVQLTVNAKKGDIVQVRVAGGKAWLVGNGSAPPTDDTRAIQADDKASSAVENANIAKMAADQAEEAAAQAVESAAKAKETTDEINAYAETAGKTVTQILNDGETAGIAAQEAKSAADTAIKDLSIVEDVVGTVDWIAKHGVYRFCTETSVIEGKVYYTLTGVTITNPTGNPSRNGYYELVDGKYIPSEDIEVDPEKTYYKITAMMVKEPSGDPSTIPYYELEISEAVYQYINTHLALTDTGLRVTDGSASSVLISSSGVTIYSNGDPVAQYGKDAIIGDPSGYHIKIVGGEEPRLSFMNRSGDLATEIAYLSNDELYIPRVVVVDSMKIGNWIWDAISNQNHLTLKWEG